MVLSSFIQKQGLQGTIYHEFVLDGWVHIWNLSKELHVKCLPVEQYYGSERNL